MAATSPEQNPLPVYIHQARYVIVKKLECCGVKEIHNLSYRYYANQAKENFKDIVRASIDFCNEVDLVERHRAWPNHVKGEARDPFWCYFLFTQAQSPDRSPERKAETAYGDFLHKYIVDNNLGTVVVTEENRNPNSGSNVKAYLWSFKWDDLKAHYDALIKAEAPPVTVVQPTVGQASLNAAQWWVQR